MATSREITHEILSRGGSKIQQGVSISKNLPWRAHVFDSRERRAWYCHDCLPESDGWLRRLREVRSKSPQQKLGISGPFDLLTNEDVLLAADELAAAVLPLYPNVGNGTAETDQGVKASASDFVFEEKVRLSRSAAHSMLDRNLKRALEEKNSQRKGVMLEVVTALLLSQVDGYEVKERGISNRTQQIDVAVHNRNSAGVLGRGEIVLAEAKNWATPAGVPEYVQFLRKIHTKFGRSKLGYFITTEQASTVALDALRDSREDSLIVVIDGEHLPKLWRDPKRTITQMVEDAVFRAACR